MVMNIMNAMRKTNYFTLYSGITPDDLKKQYRTLSKQHHPDRPTGDNTRFAEMNMEYYNLLKDFENKAQQEHDTLKYSNLSFQIERHLQNIILHINSHENLYNAIYQEIRQPLLSLFPEKYHSLIEDFTLLIEKHTKRGKEGKIR